MLQSDRYKFHCFIIWTWQVWLSAPNCDFTVVVSVGMVTCMWRGQIGVKLGVQTQGQVPLDPERIIGTPLVMFWCTVYIHIYPWSILLVGFVTQFMILLYSKMEECSFIVTFLSIRHSLSSLVGPFVYQSNRSL